MKRIAVYLPDGVYESLEKHAQEEGRPISNLAAFLIERSLRDFEPMKATENQPTVTTGDRSGEGGKKK